MTVEQKLEKLLALNEGHFTTMQAHQMKLHNYQIQEIIREGLVERVAQGLYVGAEYFPDPFAVIQHRVPKGVFSHLTALYLHGLSSRDPIIYMLTIPSGNDSRMAKNSNIRFYYNNSNLMNFGIQEIETPFGTRVWTFDVERTLCDCIKYIDKLDSDLVLTGLKDYLSSPQRNSAKMIECAEKLGIKSQIIRYLEVL